MPLLFASSINRFCHDMAHLVLLQTISLVIHRKRDKFMVKLTKHSMFFCTVRNQRLISDLKKVVKMTSCVELTFSCSFTGR